LWAKFLFFTLFIILLVWGAAVADNLFGPLGFSVIAYGGLILLALNFRERDRIYGDLGRRIPLAVCAGIVAGAVLIAVVFAVELGFDLVVVDGVSPSWPAALGAGIMIQILVAAGEELPFRGYLVPFIARHAGQAWAVVGSSAVFSVVHLATILFQGASPEQIAIMLVSIFLGGVILALLYLHSGLVAAMGFHFTWNLLQYSVFGLAQGEAAVVVSVPGDPLITGGELGPEAGLLGLAVLALGTAVLLVLSSCRRKKNYVSR